MRCLIVDDDPLICDMLEHFCSKVDFISHVTLSNSGFEAINLINQRTFDLILLDYDLPDITGKDILQVVDNHTPVIMITANKDFGHESYNYDQIVDFLVKPIEFTRFFKGVLKVKKEIPNILKTENHLFIKDGNSLVKVNLNEVLYIKSAGNYAELIFEKKKVMTLMTLKEMETKLPSHFQRVHRSCIVNVDKVESIANGDVRIQDHEISISSSYEHDLMKKINLLN
ncbi:LytTR family DNA-binding domain-containing protein [Reichenbachiella agarivorans]|uniref:LytTR family DNA-binding domain-containing protein n=1 Tax=Reichenbachiella agarivorans TaxID=2979464 RepID=A0ABY6CKW6_9BACT|nr:LytTR family DNA-binding domain-containing protein [Reichenbachiella agarivorans]UXP31160.1 LytTR family DNA-binding domain-containing protein [Reichenbachiella agarivorans]